MLITPEIIKKHIHGMYLLKDGIVYGKVVVRILRETYFDFSHVLVIRNGDDEDWFHVNGIIADLSSRHTMENFNSTFRIMRATSRYDNLSNDDLIRKAVMHRIYMGIYDNYSRLGLTVRDKIKLVSADKLTLYDL